MADYSISIESEVPASREAVWAHVTQMKNVNAELSPFITMTYPKDRSELAGHVVVPTHVVLFTSVLLLFGWIPFDLHYLSFDRIVEGSAFYENSTTLLNRYWKHTRIISQRGQRVFVSDEVHFSPRVPLIGNIMVPIVRYIFNSRHHNLKNAFSK
jgi:ligand-binding SRPBCC domain-containing protein